MIETGTRHFSRVSMSAALTAGLLAGATPPGASAQEKLMFAWPGNMSSGIAPFVFASDLGYFKEEGANLDVVVLSGSGVINPQLLSGALFTTYTTTELYRSFRASRASEFRLPLRLQRRPQVDLGNVGA